MNRNSKAHGEERSNCYGLPVTVFHNTWTNADVSRLVWMSRITCDDLLPNPGQFCIGRWIWTHHLGVCKCPKNILEDRHNTRRASLISLSRIRIEKRVAFFHTQSLVSKKYVYSVAESVHDRGKAYSHDTLLQVEETPDPKFLSYQSSVHYSLSRPIIWKTLSVRRSDTLDLIYLS